MKFSMNKSELLSAISVPCAVAEKVRVDYLSCVLVEASGDSVRFTGTDLTRSARCSSQALVEAEGVALIGAMRLLRIVKSLPNEAVEVEADGKSASVSCGRSRFSVPALTPQDFPAFPEVEAEQTLTLGAGVFASMAKAALASTIAENAKDDRMWAKCVHVRANADNIMCEGTDGYRIMRKHVPNDDGQAFDAMLPPGFLKQALSAPLKGELTISASSGHVAISCGTFEVSSSVVNGEYADTSRFFCAPDALNARAKVDRDGLMAAIKRAETVGTSTDAVRLDVDSFVLGVSRESTDRSETMSDALDAETEGKCDVYVRVEFLRDAVAAASGDEVALGIVNPLKPLLVESPDMSACVMPVRRP